MVRDQTTGAGFSGGEFQATVAQKRANRLFERNVHAGSYTTSDVKQLKA
jgi:hypothetical protein